MIVIKDEDRIVEMFDTVAEFKQYIKETLTEMSEQMFNDGIENQGRLEHVLNHKVSFGNMLEVYTELTDNSIASEV